MTYFELILQRPLENLPTLAFILVGFFQVAKMAMGLFSTNQKLQAGSQAIISQDNGLQGKLLDEMTARRVSDEQLKLRLLHLFDEKVSRIDGTTLRIDGTTLATSADVKAIGTRLDQFFTLLQAKGLI